MRVTDPNHLVIVSPTTTGEVYCIAVELDRGGGTTYRYGTQDAATYDECRGDWPA